jgi:hypothetical protein
MKTKHKEACALKETKELATIVRGGSQKNAFEPTSKKREKSRVKGF